MKLKLPVRRALDEQFYLPAQGSRGSLLTALVQILHRQFIEVDALVKRTVVSATTCHEQHLLLIATSSVVEWTRARNTGRLPTGSPQASR